MNPLPAFRPDLPAARVDESLRQALAVLDRARECALLWFAEVARRKLFLEIGFPSLEQYATEGLGFSRNRFWQFRKLVDDLQRLPRLEAAVQSGDLGWTKAQQVARVATPASEAGWVEKARTVGRRELAREVHRVRESAKKRRRARQGTVATVAADPPVSVSFRLDGPQLARYEALIERIRKRGLVAREAGREEMLLEALAALVESGDLRRRKRASAEPPTQVIVKRCPECKTTTVVTNQGERRLSRQQTEAMMCDARIRDTGKPNRATIPPSVRAEVLARDGHRCQAPGCRAARFLEVHHVVPRERGGTNRADNLITLCSRCHRFAHGLPWPRVGDSARLSPSIPGRESCAVSSSRPP